MANRRHAGGTASAMYNLMRKERDDALAEVTRLKTLAKPTPEDLEILNAVIRRAENGIDMGGGIGFLHPDIKAAKRIVARLS